MQEAISVMLSGRKGPAWIEVPLDIQGSEYIDENQIEKLPIELDKIKSIKVVSLMIGHQNIFKKRIILLVGQGVRLDGAVEKLNKFASNNQIVVSSTFPGKDCIFPYENPLFIGHPGTVAKRSANMKAIQNCDLLISIGCSLNNIITAYNSFDFARNALKIIFDIDENELSKSLPPNSLKIKSSANEAINELQKAFEKFGSRL